MRPENDSMVGMTVDHGRFELVRMIGEGGMGRVFQARQTSMNRMVALKILRASVSNDEKLLARFEQEARSLSRLKHPNTITVHDFGRLEDGSPYIAMELLGGQSLSSLLHEVGRLEQTRALHIMEQVCGAVAEAHQLGVIHRDLKPENVQIDRMGNDDDYAKVLDFGIAKIVHGDGDDNSEESSSLTLAGAVFGTPHYMSPEQVHGERVDHRTDIYSLGIILYELLTGKPPFDGATPMAVMMSQASKPAPDIRHTHPELGIADEVAELINDALIKDREARLGHIEDMLARIQGAMAALGDFSGTFRQYSSGAHIMPTERSSVDNMPRMTPQHAGQIETIPPTSGGSAKVIIALLLLILGGGGYFAYTQLQGPSVPDDQPLTIKFDPQNEPVEYTLLTTPAAAKVYDQKTNELLGETPATLKVKRKGKRQVRVEHQGYQSIYLVMEGMGPAKQEQHIEMDVDPNAAAPDAAPKPAVVVDAGVGEPAPATPAAAQDWIKLDSKPSNATVHIGKEKLGETPLEWRPKLGEKTIRLSFSKHGYKTHILKVKPKAAGEEARPLKVVLKKRKPKRSTKPKNGKHVKKPKDPKKDPTQPKKYEKL